MQVGHEGFHTKKQKKNTCLVMKRNLFLRALIFIICCYRAKENTHSKIAYEL